MATEPGTRFTHKILINNPQKKEKMMHWKSKLNETNIRAEKNHGLWTSNSKHRSRRLLIARPPRLAPAGLRYAKHRGPWIVEGLLPNGILPDLNIIRKPLRAQARVSFLRDLLIKKRLKRAISDRDSPGEARSMRKPVSYPRPSRAEA